MAGPEIRNIKVTELPLELQKGKKKKTTSSAPSTQDEVVFSSEANSNSRKSTKNKKRNVYSNDGEIMWGDDVSQIKLGDEFDFAGSTADFDKRRALEEFELNDTVDSADRLVTHNKVKTKYGHDENVIENKVDKWDDHKAVSTGIAATSSSSNKEASAALLAMIQPRASSASSTPKPSATPAGSKRSPSLETRGYQLLSKNKEPLPLATPVQLIEIERLCSENFKVTPAIITENASREIASLVFKMLGGSSRISKSNHNLPPLVLLLVGNNRSGARSLATGRHLLNHGIRVIAYTLTDFKATDELDDIVKQQLEMFEAVGGKLAFALTELLTIITSVETPPEVVVDGLQGYDTSLGDLWGSELDNAQHIISWVNEQAIKVISLDVPSGIDAGSGLLSERTPIEARFVVSTGLPVNGLVLSYSNHVSQKGDWTHYLVDVGMPHKLFKQGKLRKFDRNWFDGEFVVELDVVEQ